jgi:hypothetical protein
MAERPGLGLAMGIQSGLTALATGIAQRKQRTYETDQQERAAKAFNRYLQTGEVDPALFSLGAPMINALTPQTPQPSGSITPGNYVPDPNSPGGYKQVGEPKSAGPPSNPRPPYRSATMLEDGKPKFVNKGGAILQEYDLISPITGEKVGKSYSKIDDESKADPNTQSVMGNIANSFLRSPAVAKDQQMSDASSTIIELLDSKNPVADNSIPTFMARASGEVGNLSEADKAPFGGSAAITNKINQITQKAMTGALTDDNRKFVRDLAVLMGKSAQRRRSSVAKKYAKTYSKAHKIPEEDIMLMLDPDNVIDTNAPPDSSEQFKIIEVK